MLIYLYLAITALRVFIEVLWPYSWRFSLSESDDSEREGNEGGGDASSQDSLSS